mgnify:CR=1 FL=1
MRTRDPLRTAQIRHEGLKMLVEQGLDGFSMQKLARAAKVSPATLYIHFRDRDDLLFQLYKEHMESLASDTLQDFDPALPLAEGLRIQWRNRVRFCRSNPLGWRFLEQIVHSPYHRQFAHRLRIPFFAIMGDFVRGAIARGELTDFGSTGTELANYPAELFWSLAFAPLYHLLRFEDGFDGPGTLHGNEPFRLDQKKLDLLLERVLRALRP